MCCYIFAVYSQIFNDTWAEIKDMSTKEQFKSADSSIFHIMKSAKSKNTVKQYETYFKKFTQWCISKDVESFPAKSSVIAIFLSGLIQQGVSEAVLCSFFYSIKWNHDLHCAFSNPCDDSVIHSLMEGGKRILSKPIKKKEPISPDVLEKIINVYGEREQNCDLRSVRTVAMLLLSFAGFLRFSELSNIKVKNIIFKNLYMNVCIESSKTDVYRRGNEVTLAEAGGKLCPVSWIKHYLNLAEIQDKPEEYVFRAIRFYKSCGKYMLCGINKPISYTRARELLLEALEKVGIDSKGFGLHSLRSGGATTAAEKNVSERLIKIHGRWKSDYSRDNYIKDCIDNKLKVSNSLFV